MRGRGGGFVLHGFFAVDINRGGDRVVGASCTLDAQLACTDASLATITGDVCPDGTSNGP